MRYKGAKLQHNILGCDFLFGNVKGLNNGAFILLESGVKLNIASDDAVLTLGNYVYINSYSIIDCHYSISIGNRVQIGPHCYIGDSDHNLNVDIRKPHHRMGNTYAKVKIEDNVWIGAGVIVLKGVTVGKNSIIAAGSVVVKDIPENVLAAGVPARVIKNIEGNIDQL